MNREAIATGNTVEEAREKACEMLGVETYDDNVDFEINILSFFYQLLKTYIFLYKYAIYKESVKIRRKIYE